MKYNQNTGATPQLGDHVSVCHTGTNGCDGLRGVIGGFYDRSAYIAIVVLDHEISNGETAMCMPVVCLKHIADNASVA